MKKVAYGGLISALVVLLLYIGNFTKSKIFFAALSSVFTGVLVELFGVGSVPIIIATNVLVFLLVPNPGYASLFFVLSFYGFLRKKPILIRFLYLNASTLLLVLFASKFFNAELPDVSFFSTHSAFLEFRLRSSSMTICTTGSFKNFSESSGGKIDVWIYQTLEVRTESEGVRRI